ncbi:hypothetical protein LC040_09570 [Bacillus tianshenii]|nr:hypothetical protein LC040_09570 [Bacillus tianshenii]
MDGLLFYWLCWLGWIYTTFIMSKRKERNWFAVFILGLIILSETSFFVKGFEVNASYLFLLLTACALSYFLSRVEKVLLLFASLAVTAAFMAFHLFELYDPVWVIADRKWLLAGILFLVTVLISDSFLFRAAAVIIGMCEGEWLYTFLLRPYSFNGEVGQFEFLDIAACTIMAVVLWGGFERLILWLNRQMQRSFSERQ